MTSQDTRPILPPELIPDEMLSDSGPGGFAATRESRLGELVPEAEPSAVQLVLLLEEDSDPSDFQSPVPDRLQVQPVVDPLDLLDLEPFKESFHVGLVFPTLDDLQRARLYFGEGRVLLASSESNSHRLSGGGSGIFVSFEALSDLLPPLNQSELALKEAFPTEASSVSAPDQEDVE